MPYRLIRSRAVSSNVKKPTMLQLSTVNSKKKLSEKIQQRLLHRPPLTPSHEDDMTAAFMVRLQHRPVA